MIEITLYWWYIPIILIILPFIIIWILEKTGHIGGDWDFTGPLVVLFILVVCWVAAIALIIGKLI